MFQKRMVDVKSDGEKIFSEDTASLDASRGCGVSSSLYHYPEVTLERTLVTGG